MIRLGLPGSVLATALFLSPVLSPAQTISIVSGNGQLVCPVCPALTVQQFAPLVVLVTGANGQPAAGVAVSWATKPTTGIAPQTAQATTGTNGQASFNFVPVFPNNGSTINQTPVVATALNSSVQFIETTLIPNQQTPGIAPVQISLATPAQALTGSAGQTGSTPIKVQVVGFLGGIPGISVQLISGASPGPTVSCMAVAGQQPGTVLTDSTGTATCTPVFGGTIGTGSYQVAVGGTYVTFTPAALTVTAGPAAILKIISGNNQSVNPGSIAPLSLVAEVTDLGGNPTAGATVVWEVMQGSATLSNTTTTSNSTGQVSTRVTATGAGQILVQVILPNTTSKVTFTVNVNTVITQFQTVSGDNQQTQIGTAFPQPLIVQVNNQGQPVQGVNVIFVVASGSAALSAASATTNTQGQAQVTVTAGTTPGPVTITASISGSTLTAQTFNLTVTPPGPVISANGFTNAAGFQPGFISPCGLATIFGSGLATGMQGAVSSFLVPQTQMAGVTVQFGTASAPILSVVNENGQESVTVQVPCEVTPGSVPVTVAVVNGGSTTVTVNVLPISPGLFQTTMSDGKMRAVSVRPDGTFVSLENPARRGEIIRMYATGLGQTTPALVTGQTVPLIADASGNLTPEDLNVNAQVVIGVNNAGVRVVSARYAYGMVGVYEVQFEVPADTATGNDAPFAIAVYQGTNLLFGNPSAIPIQ
jgi:uncharacterized protein (TIGR03437 family)